MDSTKLAMSLLMLMALTTTWARSISEHRNEVTVREDIESRDNSMKLYLRKQDAISKSIDGRENEKYDDNFIARYAKSEAEKISRKSMRVSGKKRRSLHGNEDKVEEPFSARRLEKMLEKAILKIITGDLSTADMLLLKSFNYSLEEVLAIRERELGKKNRIPETPDVGEKIFYEPKLNNDLVENERSLTQSSRLNKDKNDDDKISKKMKKKNKIKTMSVESSGEKKSSGDNFDFDAYNRQAIYDYENEANKMSRQADLNPITASIDYENRSGDEIETTDFEDDTPDNFNRPMEPHVVFKIRYDDSEFDSNSKERTEKLSRERIGRVISENHHVYNNRKPKNRGIDFVPSTKSLPSEVHATSVNNANKTFQASTIDVISSLPATYRLGNFVTTQDGLTTVKNRNEERTKSNEKDMGGEETEDTLLSSTETSTIDQTSGSLTSESEMLEKNNVDVDRSMNNETFDSWQRKNIYEGLEWVEDDVYRVIPEAIDSLNYYDGSVNETENDTMEDSKIDETSSFEIDRRNENNDDNENDTIGYQNETPEGEEATQTEDAFSTMRNSPNVNLSTYQQLALAHRRDSNVTLPFDSQSQKAIEDIKLKVLAMTGRFNLSSNGNQVQRERLTMFSPICQTPRNTDAEAWSDSFLMNMNYQLNLTSGDHVVAAKVRIYVLPQNNITVTSSGAAEEEDEEEKKIRISIYFYTKSLKKHRSKKRLIDSVVVSLTTQGSHWALDVRPALRFWRQNVRNSHGTSNNHGLVIQVEDQDGRSLKPSEYIQQDSCHTSDFNNDEKAYQRFPALFLQACSRYVRVVNGEPVTYVNCRKSSRKGRH